MSDDEAPKGPSHIAFQVNETEDGKSFFNRVGAAFPHKDGQGYNVLLDSLPLDGRVTLRTPKERLEAMEQQQAQAAQQEQAATQEQAVQQPPAPADRSMDEPER